MLVYANHLTLEGSGAPDAIFRAVGGWLKEQMGRGLHLAKLKSEGKHDGNKRDGTPSTLRIYTASEGAIEYYAWVLKHPDKDDRDRQWITEIGVESGSEKLDISFVVQTEEMSARVDPPSVSRPRVVQYVVENIKKADDARFSEKSIPVYKTKQIGEGSDSYRALLADIEKEDRRYPIVLVSPTDEGEYLLDADYLQNKLIELAQVVRVTSNFNLDEMKEILREFSTYAGAVNILYTPNKFRKLRPLRYSADNINSWGDRQDDRASEILSLVTRETNRFYYRLRIRPEKIAQRSMHQRSEELLLKSAKITAGKYEEERKKNTHEKDMWLEIAEDKSKEVDELNNQIDKLNDEINDLKEKNYQKNNTIEHLENRLKSEKNDENIDFLIDFLCQENLTALNCLEIIEKIYGNKCDVLETAKKSARKSTFEEGRVLLRQLILLVTKYRESLINGGGDSQAKDIFGDDYAAMESETVMENKKFKRARIFEYDGRMEEMFRHLKIGVSSDEKKTVRTHFYWDGEKKVIAIGHCGKHLPLPKRRKRKN
ncbi:hypothetical protein [Thioalkalivibrio sp. HK1]|uniref:hypothetical protein n=1 Tax=Thioalkalivibrio sp. HK1 TaxID=1469245 RepID=UPI0004B10C66|nr:hypothetical protein [Thioalkalivibrio sp. HK1]